MPPIDDPFGTPAGGGNGSPPDDRTMIMPRPGGRAPEPAGGPQRIAAPKRLLWLKDNLGSTLVRIGFGPSRNRPDKE